MIPDPRDAFDLWLYSPTLRKAHNARGFATLDADRPDKGIGALKAVYAAEMFPLDFLPGLTNEATAGPIDWWVVPMVHHGASGVMLFDTPWLLRSCSWWTDGGGKQYQIICQSANIYVSSRWVIFASDTPEGSKGAKADDMMKAIIREHFTAADDPDRNISSAFFTVAPDTGDAPIVDMITAWRRCDDILAEIAGASAAHDTTPTELFWDIVATEIEPNLKLQFRTFVGSRGPDHSSTGNNPKVLSFAQGHLTSPRVTLDYTEERNAVMAGGAEVREEGVPISRPLSAWRTDDTAIGRGPFSRWEDFISATDIDEAKPDALEDQANMGLAKGRPRRVFTATVNDVPGAVYGRDWDFGWKVIGEYDDDQFDARIQSGRMSVSGSGRAISGALVSV